MDPHREKSDPLHDGSASSYVARFFICFLLGIFADLFILVGAVFFLSGFLTEFWYVLLVVPAVFGAFGVFVFDAIVGIYEKMHGDYVSDNRK